MLYYFSLHLYVPAAASLVSVLTFLSSPHLHFLSVPVSPWWALGSDWDSLSAAFLSDCVPNITMRGSLQRTDLLTLTVHVCISGGPYCLPSPGLLFPLCLLMGETACASFHNMTFAWSVCAQDHATHSILSADSCNSMWSLT